MKNVVRFVFSIVVLSSLAVSQLPETGNCQMALGAFFAASCPMPCCKTTLPMPNCPLLKAATPRDFVASSAPILEVGLTPLHFAQTTILPQPRFLSTIVSDLTATITLLLMGSSQAVRAPPSDVHLQAA
jgi:hypothetical protein